MKLFIKNISTSTSIKKKIKYNPYTVINKTTVATFTYQSKRIVSLFTRVLLLFSVKYLFSYLLNSQSYYYFFFLLCIVHYFNIQFIMLSIVQY